MKLVVFLIFLMLGILAWRRARWAYAVFVILGLLYFPASMGFRVEPKPCDLAVDVPLALDSLSNYGHIILFFIFFLITARQFRLSGWAPLGWSIGLTMAMGVAVEIAEALSGAHHCKTSDLIPDFVGALLGVVAVVLSALAAGAKFSHKNGTGRSGTVELGAEIAQAMAAQRRHEETHGAPNSPLADLRYSSIEHRLWRWVDSLIDGRIEPVVTDFATLGEAERNSVRDSLSIDDFYTLFTFARRRALAALRGNSTQIEPAFVSLAMIDLERVDWRDLLMANSLLCYAGERIGAPVADLLRRSAHLAERKTAEALKGQRTAGIDLAASCGYREVRTSEGVALFDTSYEHFSPEADLERIAFDSAVALESNGYEIEDISLASDLPLTWLNGREGSAIAKMARSLSGCVVIHGIPRADPAPESSGQSLRVFLAEAASESDARQIAAAAENASGSQRTELGLALGRICAVIIQHSWIADTPPMEDERSLERLRGVFERLLN